MSTEKPKAEKPKDEKSEAVKQAHDDAKSPEEKHEAYLALLEKLHSEP